MIMLKLKNKHEMALDFITQLFVIHTHTHIYIYFHWNRIYSYMKICQRWRYGFFNECSSAWYVIRKLFSKENFKQKIENYYHSVQVNSVQYIHNRSSFFGKLYIYIYIYIKKKLRILKFYGCRLSYLKFNSFFFLNTTTNLINGRRPDLIIIYFF